MRRLRLPVHFHWPLVSNLQFNQLSQVVSMIYRFCDRNKGISYFFLSCFCLSTLQLSLLMLTQWACVRAWIKHSPPPPAQAALASLHIYKLNKRPTLVSLINLQFILSLSHNHRVIRSLCARKVFLIEYWWKQLTHRHQVRLRGKQWVTIRTTTLTSFILLQQWHFMVHTRTCSSPSPSPCSPYLEMTEKFLTRRFTWPLLSQLIADVRVGRMWL